MAKSLTQSRLRTLFHYDPDTGVFTRLSKAGHERKGEAAGYRDTHGYVKLGVDYRRYYAHRLAWLYVTGEWPSEIDHINFDRADNRFANLRLATHRQNQTHRTVRRDSRSGFKGVRWHPQNRKWQSRITICGKQIGLGYFDTAQEAHTAYVIAARKEHGDFATA